MAAGVVIVGVGALGSHLVLWARNWPARIKIVDYDRVEQKNLLAQFHTRMGLGKNKAQALQQAMQGMFGTRLEAVPHRLSEDNAEVLLGGGDLVVDCTDNAATRRVIQVSVRRLGLPCVHGALSADGGFARVVWDELFVVDEEGSEGAATCENGEALAFFALAAAHLAGAVQRFLATGERRSCQITPTTVTRIA
ncbi:MAG: ThiF family adenylyltransferase [Candidatus Schekmanbacteria bacterium]|nr:ThiF family adenylyltransferase [Candidatus Schekmanbacteria bacterium]